MVHVKLFAANGGKVRGLTHIVSGMLGAMPKEGDYINMGTAVVDLAFKVEAVAFLINEDAVRLIVSPVNI